MKTTTTSHESMSGHGGGGGRRKEVGSGRGRKRKDVKEGSDIQGSNAKMHPSPISISPSLGVIGEGVGKVKRQRGRCGGGGVVCVWWQRKKLFSFWMG